LYLKMLAEDYETAILANDEAAIHRIWENIYYDEEAIAYLKKYRSRLYRIFRQQDYNTTSRLVTEEGVLTGKEVFDEKKLAVSQTLDQYSLEQKRELSQREMALKYPIEKRRPNREIAGDEPNRNLYDNRKIAMNFPNQDRMNNRELIEQRLNQTRRDSVAANLPSVYAKTGSEAGHVDDMAYGDFHVRSSHTLMMSVSGVNEEQGRELIKVLESYFKSIKNIKEVGYGDGMMEYLISIEGNPEEFARRVEQREFGSFKLDLVRHLKGKLDFRIQYL